MEFPRGTAPLTLVFFPIDNQGWLLYQIGCVLFAPCTRLGQAIPQRRVEGAYGKWIHERLLSSSPSTVSFSFGCVCDKPWSKTTAPRPFLYRSTPSKPFSHGIPLSRSLEHPLSEGRPRWVTGPTRKRDLRIVGCCFGVISKSIQSHFVVSFF